MTGRRKTAKQTVTVERDPRGANPQKHGILSEFIPPEERAAYEQHVQAVRESSGATNYLQQRLADRAALALWRLDRVAFYEAAQASHAARLVRESVAEAEPYGQVGGVTKLYKRLQELGYESAEAYRKTPKLVEEHAADWEREAVGLLLLSQGEDVPGLAEKGGDVAMSLGLEVWGVLERLPQFTGEAIVQAMTGKAATPDEVEALEDHNWMFDQSNVQGLVRLLTTEHVNGALILRYRAQDLQEKARVLRTTLAEALGKTQDLQTLALLPDGPVLDKVMRYEAHLERVLYRALHDLEALRREGGGDPTLGPVRGVFDGLKGPEA